MWRIPGLFPSSRQLLRARRRNSDRPVWSLGLLHRVQLRHFRRFRLQSGSELIFFDGGADVCSDALAPGCSGIHPARLLPVLPPLGGGYVSPRWIGRRPTSSKLRRSSRNRWGRKDVRLPANMGFDRDVDELFVFMQSFSVAFTRFRLVRYQ